MRPAAKQKEKLENPNPLFSKKEHFELAESENQNMPFEYLRRFKGKKIPISENRWLEIESVRKNSGVKVLFADSNNELKEEILKNPVHLEKLKRLIDRANRNNALEKNEEKKEKAKPKKPASKKPKLKLVVNNTKNIQEDEAGVSQDSSPFNVTDHNLIGKIDSEKRKDGEMEIWTKKVERAKTILELCDIVEEIGDTEANGKVVPFPAMSVRLKILDEFSSKELIEWKLEEITEEFGIRDRAREIKLAYLDKASKSEKSDNVLEFEKKEETEQVKPEKDIETKKEDIQKFLEEMNEAKKRLDEAEEKIKNIKGFFKTSAVALKSSEEAFEKELRTLREAYENAKKRHEEAVSGENGGIASSSEELKQAA